MTKEQFKNLKINIKNWDNQTLLGHYSLISSQIREKGFNGGEELEELKQEEDLMRKEILNRMN